MGKQFGGYQPKAQEEGLGTPRPPIETPDREMVSSAGDDRTVNNVLRHEYRVLSDSEKKDMQEIKDLGLAFLSKIVRLETAHGPSRELSLARTKTEEAVMWAVKHITH